MKAHHFAHEASQERPECFVGALNLLRRVAAEFLRERGNPVLPIYRRQVSRRLLAGLTTEQVEWDAQPVRVEWMDRGLQDSPVARMLLDNEVSVNLLITIAEDPPAPAQLASSDGLITFYTHLPNYEVLCSHTGVLEHLRRTGRFVWVYQPDVYGLVNDAATRLRSRFEAEELQAEERAQRVREQFERRRVEVAAPVGPVPGGPSVAAQPWVAEKKTNSSYFGYRFADGSVWVHFELKSGGHGLRKLGANTQWHAEVPESLGQYAAELDLVVCPKVPALPRPVATRISSQLVDVLQLLGEGWNKAGFFQKS
ncbi:MAG: hypothetical protein V4684_04535 [Pseudomonadota bacterium]